MRCSCLLISGLNFQQKPRSMFVYRISVKYLLRFFLSCWKFHIFLEMVRNICLFYFLPSFNLLPIHFTISPRRPQKHSRIFRRDERSEGTKKVHPASTQFKFMRLLRGASKRTYNFEDRVWLRDRDDMKHISNWQVSAVVIYTWVCRRVMLVKRVNWSVKTTDLTPNTFKVSLFSSFALQRSQMIVTWGKSSIKYAKMCLWGSRHATMVA